MPGSNGAGVAKFCFAKTSVCFSFLLPPRPNLRFHTGKNAYNNEHMYPYYAISGVSGLGRKGPAESVREGAIEGATAAGADQNNSLSASWGSTAGIGERS